MSVKRMAVSMLFSLLAIGSPVAYASTQVQAANEQTTESQVTTDTNLRNGAGKQYQQCQNESCLNESCPNECIRVLDGTGYQGGNGKKNEPCLNENCPHDGIRVLDGTGYKRQYGRNGNDLER